MMKNANVLLKYLIKNKSAVDIPSVDALKFKFLNIQRYGAVIAGGAALRWHCGQSVGAHDIDIWCPDATQYNRMLAHLHEHNTEHTYDTDNAITFKRGPYKIQLIKTPYPSVPELLDSFDISVAQVATDGVHWYYGEHTLQDIQDRKLRVLKQHRTILRRLFKYWTYGYKPDDATLQELINNKEILWEYSSANNDDY